MASPTVMSALRTPGQIIINPSAGLLTQAPPHGGTSLGFVGNAKVRRIGREFEQTCEEWGGEVGDLVYLGEEWSLAFDLRNQDGDAIAACFANTSEHSPSGQRGIDHPGTALVAGQSLYDEKSVALLFSPNDRQRHCAVYFRKAIPRIALEIESDLSRGSERLFVVGFRAMRDDTTPLASVQVRLLEDIDL